MIDADAARREGFVPLGASRKGSSFRGGRAAANDTAAEIGSLGKGHFLQEQIVKGPAASLPRRKSLDERNEAKRFVFERAKDLGVRSVVIDAPGSWAERMVGERVIAKFIPLDLNRASTSVLNDCAAAIRA